MLEFIINDFITLKLEEDGITDIYVLGEKFIQCKYLLINIPVQKLKYYEEINSIDEAAEKLDKSLELGNLEGYNFERKFRPEVEFWGHCSNLQVWAEQNYDTRFIHSNLAFPLLKKLTEVGDLKAEKLFKDEIGKRFEKGPDSVRQYLVLEGYMDYLSREEMWNVMPNQSEVKILHAIERETGIEFKIFPDEIDEFTWGDKPNQLAFSIKNDSVNRIEFLNFKIFSIQKWKKIFMLLGKLTALRWLILPYNKLKTIPDSIRHIRNLEVLKLDNNEIVTLPEAIGDLKRLIWLTLNNNKIKNLPKSIGRIHLLEELRLDYNQLAELPDSIGNLKFLKKLHLGYNCFVTLPDTITEMESLTQLALNCNLLTDLPEKLLKMKSLRGLRLEGNKINEGFSVIVSLKKKGVIIIL